MLRDDAGKPVAAAHLELTSKTGDHRYTNTTSRDGNFILSEIVAGEYEISVESGGKTWNSHSAIMILDGIPSNGSLQFVRPGQRRFGSSPRARSFRRRPAAASTFPAEKFRAFR